MMSTFVAINEFYAFNVRNIINIIFLFLSKFSLILTCHLSSISIRLPSSGCEETNIDPFQAVLFVLLH